MSKIEIEEWERQPFEPTRAYSYFCLYRDMEQLERSVKKFAEKVGRSVRMMWDLSSKWDWLKRAEAYDLRMQRLKQAAQEKARIEMAERQAREVTMLQNIAMGGAKNLLEQTGQIRELGAVHHLAGA